jgi:hypothetical protein
MFLPAYRRTNTQKFINYHEKTATYYAKVAKLADAPDLGSGGATHGGSSPPFRTIDSRVFSLEFPFIIRNIQVACGRRSLRPHEHESF